MAETFGSLVDRLSIINLKLWHCEEQLVSPAVEVPEEAVRARLTDKQQSLRSQRKAMIAEINVLLDRAIAAPSEVTLINPQNKIYAQKRDIVP